MAKKDTDTDDGREAPSEDLPSAAAASESWLRRAASTLADFVFPRLCPGCGERVTEKGRMACAPCLASVARLELPLCPTCGAPNCPSRCKSCPSGAIYFAAARGAVPFEGFAQVLVERMKYTRRPEYAAELVPAMLEVFREEYALRAFDSLIPVPLHKTRRRERGFNQAEELARRLSEAVEIPVASNLLLRERPTPSQTKLGRKARAQNIHGAFSCPLPYRVRNRQFLLVDDVFTSGATINECARMLREAGAAGVWALAYARAAL